MFPIDPDAVRPQRSACKELFRSQRLQAAGGAEDDDGLLVLVFRSRLHLIPREFQRDEILLVARHGKMQGIPVDRDLATADTKESAEVDYGCADLTSAIDDDVDDTSHVLVGGATDLLAEHALGLMRTKNGDRRLRNLGRRVCGRK